MQTSPVESTILEKILLAAPRGFCAGVAYAIEVVDLALKIHGAPLYVRHAIVHNEWVVKSFEKRGVVFVEDVSEIPEGAPVVFSAHGVSPQVRAVAAERGLTVIDATCPLVTKVHNEAKHFAAKDFYFIYIGHEGHVEAEGTMGEAPGRMVLVETPEDAEALVLPEHWDKIAVLTQTTLSVDEVNSTMAVLRRRFPHLVTPPKEDICYATTNRQAAVKQMANECDLVLIVGSTTSSNSNRLREVAESLGCEAHLLMSPDQVSPEWRTRRIIGISSGASTPEHLVEAIIGKLLEGQPEVPVEVLQTVKEDLSFKPPRDLIQLAMAR
jgi:4-hydroxy-3-methylbut-2-enyl diphosphate reductase